jgi:hypothetical protein
VAASEAGQTCKNEPSEPDQGGHGPGVACELYYAPYVRELQERGARLVLAEMRVFSLLMGGEGPPRESNRCTLRLGRGAGCSALASPFHVSNKTHTAWTRECLIPRRAFVLSAAAQLTAAFKTRRPAMWRALGLTSFHLRLELFHVG